MVILYKDIYHVSEITTWPQKGWKTFTILCRPLNNNSLGNTQYEIHIPANDETVYNLILKNYEHQSFKKDELMGIK